MNKWLLTGIIIVVVLILIGVAYDQGLFDSISGSGFAMILAGLAGPYVALKNWFTDDKFRKEFKNKYENIRAQEIVHRSEMDTQIKSKEKRIAELDKEIQLLDAKMEVLELKKKRVEQSVNELSLDETKSEAQRLFGD